MRNATRFILAAVAGLVLCASPAQALTDLSGNYFAYGVPDQGTPPVDAENLYRLVGDTGFGWTMGTRNYNIDFNGFTLNQNTGGGNYHNLSGALTGATGIYNLISGGSAAPAVLSGSEANTFAGDYNISVGTNRLELNKTPDVAAISGTLNLNGGTIRWLADNQIANTSPVNMAGGTTLDLNGHSEVAGALNLTGGVSSLNLNSVGIVAFADSSAVAWNGQWKILGWAGDTLGGGFNQLLFGNSASALSADQLSRIYFQDPAGFEPGYYTPKILATGEIVPDALSGGPAVLWSGYITNPNSELGAGNASRLSGDGTFGWQTGTCTIPVDLNGFNFTVDNGGGNTANVNGALTGIGNVKLLGRGGMNPDTNDDTWFNGSSANTYSGTTLVQSGTVKLNKTGVLAIPGDLQIGNGTTGAVVRLVQSDQIADAAVVSLQLASNTNYGLWRLNGQNETIGGLQSLGAGSNGYVENGSATASVSTLTLLTADGTSHDYAGSLRDESSTAGKGAKLAVVKSGPGTQILSGMNTYTGGTTVNAGVLTLNGSLPNANIIVNGGTLNGTATITFQDNDLINIAAGGTVDASDILHMQWDLMNLTGTPPITLLDYSSGGAFLPPTALDDLLTTLSYNSGWRLTNANSQITAAMAIAYAWNVDKDGDWSVAENWITGSPNSVGGTANFLDTITQPRSVFVDGPVILGLVKFNSTVAYTLTGSEGNLLTLDTEGGNAAIQSVLGDHEIAALMTLNKTTDVTVVAWENTLTLSGNISGGSAEVGLNKNGAGTLLLSGANSFEGPLHVNAGTLKLSGGSAIGDLTDVVVAANATLDLNGSDETVGAITNNGSIAMNDGTLRITKASTVAGLIGTGTFYKIGSGNLTLGNNSSFSGEMHITGNNVSAVAGGFGDAAGATTLDGVYWGGINAAVGGNEHFIITGGTTRFSNWGGNPQLTNNITVEAGVTLVADTGGGNNGAYNGVFDGEGNFTFESNGSGGWEFSATTLGGSLANTLSGTTWVKAGTMDLGKSAEVDAIAGPLTIGDGVNNAHVRLNANEQINNAVIVTIANKGDLRLQGRTETIGGLVSNFGEGAVGNYGTQPGTLNVLLSSADMEFGGALLDGGEGPLSLVKSGDMTLTLNGVNTYTGGTTVAGGKLLLGVGVTLNPLATLTVAPAGDSAVFDLGGQEQTIAALALGGQTETSAASVAIGLGKLTLGGDVTYDATLNPAGATISGDEGGILDLGAATRTFDIGDSTATTAEVTVAATISGTGAGLIKAGDGTLALAGAENNYDGDTQVTGGTLLVASAGALPTGGSLTIGESGTVVLAAGLSAAASNASGVTAVPEPGTMALLAVGAVALLLSLRRRKVR